MRIFSESAERLALGPVQCATNGTVHGETIDQRGAPYFRETVFVIVAGEITDGTHSLVIQESADGTTWTDVPDTKLVGGANNAELVEHAVTSLFYAGTQPYVRSNIATVDVPDPDGVGGMFAGIVIQNKPRHRPAR